MDKLYSPRKQSSLSCAEPAVQRDAGFTILELLISMTIMVIAGAMAFSVAIGARRLYDADAARTDLNQTLRSAIDMITSEVRQSGEWIPSDFPTIELVNDANGDTLIVRKSLTETALQSCTDKSTGESRIRISTTTGSGQCAEADDLDSDTWPDNIQVFREYRLANGDENDELANVYLFDPNSKNGDWVTHTGEEFQSNMWSLNVTGLDGNFDAADQPRVYILDETRFELDASTGVLQMKRDGQNTAQGIVDQITNFQIDFLMQDGSTKTSFTTADDWSQIQRLRFTLTAEREVGDRTITRSITADAFPRAILSN